MTTYSSPSSVTNRLFVLALGLFLGAGTGRVAADDTEIFFPEEVVQNNDIVRPNLMFLMDTSGSMAERDGGSVTRLDRMKQALTRVLDDLGANINVGLGRLSGSEGGAILFPASNLDDVAAVIDPSLNQSVDQSVAIAGSGTNAEAYQNDTTVTLGPTNATNVLLIGTGGGAGPNTTATTTYVIDSARNEAEQYESGNVDSGDGRGTRTSDDIELSSGRNDNPPDGEDTDLFGLRFTGISIPAGATVSDARIIFTCDNTQNNAPESSIAIRGEAVGNSLSFDETPNNISNRGRNTTDAVSWRPGACRDGEELRTSNVSSIVNAIRNRGDWSLGNAMTFLFDLRNEENNRRNRVKGISDSEGLRVSPRLEITYTVSGSPTPTARQQFGLRFDNVLIPRGVVITNAQITFRGLPSIDPSRTQNGVPLNIQIGVADNPISAALNGVSNAPTGTKLNWAIPSMANGTPAVATPNLASIVMERTSDADWCGGRSLHVTFTLPAGTPSGLRAFASGFNSADGAVLSYSYSGSDPALDNSCTTDNTARQISSGENDANENATDGSLQVGANTLLLGRSGGNNQVLGLRFDSINLPQGSRILSAAIDFEAVVTDDNDRAAISALRITGEAVGTAAPFVTGLYNISGRADTSGVSWSNVPVWTSGQRYATPDLSGIVQQIVDRPDWVSGNAMAFAIDGAGLTGSNNVRRRAISAEGSRTKAPKLTITAEVPTARLTVRQYLKLLVNELPAEGNTPIPEFMYEAAQYWRGGAAYFGRTRGDGFVWNDSGDNGFPSRLHRISGSATFTAPPTIADRCTAANKSDSSCTNERITGTAVYQSPFTDQACSTNAQILLTDGLPNNATESYGLIRSNLSIASCANAANGQGNCAAEIASLLRNNDQSASLAGDQTVATYTVGLAELGLSAYLSSIATAGGGENYFANSADELATAFTSIVQRVLDIPTTFVAPAVSVDSFNRLTDRNEIYFALFRPKIETRWEGNFKRYKLGAGVDGTPTILDANNSLAVDPGTGFFRQTARSIWSTSTDGDNVAAGGIIDRFNTSRRAFTLTGSTAALEAGTGTPTSVNLFDSAHLLNESNTLLTKALLGNAAMADDVRVSTLQYARGIDAFDSDEDGSRADVRPAFGDPLHSEPALVSYGGTEAAPELVAFVGTNEGGLHAIDASTGDELWSWVPQELLPNLFRYAYNGANYQTRPYGVDGPVTPLVRDAGGMHYPFFAAGRSINLYVGLRMGGRQYYALDVTDRSNPVLKFIVRGGGSGAYRELGETWGRPVPARIRFNGATRSVVVLSGGYDRKQDGEAIPSADTMGRALYIIDSNTGERLWWGGINPGGADTPNLVMSQMRYSVPASPRVIDLDGDGLSDRIYIADVGGQVLRFDLNPANGGAADLATGSVIASLGEAHIADPASKTVLGSRRFYQTPDISIIRAPGVTPFLSVAIGSGYRGHPLEKRTQDRFFVLRDPDVAKGAASLPLRVATAPITDATLFDATDNAIGSSNATTAQNARVTLNASDGFYVRLQPSGGGLTGEKVLTDAQTFDGKVLFTSYTPAARSLGETCRASAGLSRFYLFSIVDGQPVQNFDQIGDENQLTQTDRYFELAQGGLPPTPTILFPTVSGLLPEEPLVCVGAECFNPGLSLRTEKTYWIKRQ